MTDNPSDEAIEKEAMNYGLPGGSANTAFVDGAEWAREQAKGKTMINGEWLELTTKEIIDEWLTLNLPVNKEDAPSLAKDIVNSIRKQSELTHTKEPDAFILPNYDFSNHAKQKWFDEIKALNPTVRFIEVEDKE